MPAPPATNQANPQTARPPTPARVAVAPLQPAPPAQAAQSAAVPAKREDRPKVRWLDVGGAFLLVLLGSFAVSSDLVGPLRLLAALPVLLFAPGYLLLQAVIVPPAKGASLARQALASVGISPAVVGLFALSTALVAGAFKAGVIVVLVTAGSLALAIIALQRRRGNVRAPNAKATAKRSPSAAPAAKPMAKPMSVQPAAEAARAKSGTARP